ncbi:hypothetical protein LTR53_012301 [Teratosphaeriaceae sp. CCFEE 6253]|nr:hypothetical protein LTR53_012301 [Teratosphaeriaceae sp. CCFEE 6253]
MAPTTPRKPKHGAPPPHLETARMAVVEEPATPRTTPGAAAKRCGKVQEAMPGSQAQEGGATMGSTEASTAVEDVFATAELLEKILLRVDAKTVLLSQKVSRHWREVVVGSHLLQQKLYLRSATFEEALYLTQGEDEAEVWVLTDTLGLGTGMLNPLLFDVPHSLPEAGNCPVASFRTRRHAVHSRQRMQLVHPPTTLSTGAYSGDGDRPQQDWGYRNSAAPPGMCVGEWLVAMEWQLKGSAGYAPFRAEYVAVAGLAEVLEQYRKGSAGGGEGV